MEHLLAAIRIAFVFLGALICADIGWSGVLQGDDVIAHSIVFFPLLVLTVFGARLCLENSGDLISAALYPLVFVGLALGLNRLAGEPVLWLSL